MLQGTLKKLHTRAVVLGLLLFFLASTAAVLVPPRLLAIAQGYNSADPGLKVGMVAALKADSPDSQTVERADQENATRIVGIVTTDSESLVTINSGQNKVLVENEGQVPAYVSDINGAVKKGDTLIISPFKGVLMRAGDTVGIIVAIAAEDPDTNAMSYPYTEGGVEKQAQIAKITVDAKQRGSNGSGSVDSALGKLGHALVGKPVSEIRVIAALIIFFIVLMTEGGILYGAISSAVTALGRNPLAHKVIRKELVKVGVIALIVLAVGVGAMYVVLWT